MAGNILEGIFGIIFLVIFATIIFPALGQATGQDVSFPILGMILLAVGIGAAIILAVIWGGGGEYHGRGRY
jgi:hypothetical protein